MTSNTSSVLSLTHHEECSSAAAFSAPDTVVPIYQSALLPLGSSRSIRLIEVLCCEDIQDDLTPIKCRLYLTSLDNSEPYTALSYTWGDPDETETIELDGQPFVVRRNLWAFLRQLQSHDEAARSWPDAERSELIPQRL